MSILIIGAGVIGCSIAYELSKENEDVLVIEKNPQVNSDNQSSRNSGVIHSGIYYDDKNEPLKARFCVEGNKLLYEFCKKHKIPHEKTGKLVVAANEVEESYLEEILKQAQTNEVEDIEILSEKETKKLEPNVRARSSLYVPSSGIIDPTELVKKLEYLARQNKSIFLTNTEVTEIYFDGKFKVVLKTKDNIEEFSPDIVINAAGLNSDKLVRQINKKFSYKLKYVKGEYAKFNISRPELNVKRNVYPVPQGIFPTGERFISSFEEFKRLLSEGRLNRILGIHLTPLIERETITIGPAYSSIVETEDYKPTLTEESYLEAITPFFPNLKLEDISLYQTGIQARVFGHPDFIIEKDEKIENLINLVGIDSPGLTSCLSIAKYVKKMLKN